MLGHLLALVIAAVVAQDVCNDGVCPAHRNRTDSDIDADAVAVLQNRVAVQQRHDTRYDARSADGEDEEEESYQKKGGRALLSRRSADEYEDLEKGVGSEQVANSDLWGRRRRRRRRRRISFKKTLKSVKKGASTAVKSTGTAVKSATKVINTAVVKPVTKKVKSVAKTTGNAVINTAQQVGNAIVSVANTISDKVGKFASQVVKLAKAVGNALASLINFSCFSPQKLFTRLFLPSSGVDHSQSSVDLTVSGNPKIKATIAPKMGNPKFKHALRLTTKLHEPGGASIIMKGGSEILYSPKIQLEVDAVSGKVKAKFNGDLKLRVFADVIVKKKYKHKVVEKFPKTPQKVTGCVPGFCIALMMQGVATLDLSANTVGSVGADLNATFGVAAEIEVDVFSGQTNAQVSGGQLTHQEELIYENDFDGSFKITAGPILTILPMPGAPISVKPTVTAEIKAHASAVTGKTPCGTAAINVRGKTAVEALGLPKDIDVDSKKLTAAFTTEIAQLPVKMSQAVVNMMLSCVKIPGASSAMKAMDSAVQSIASGLATVMPDFQITFGNPMVLLQPNFCFNVLKFTVPSSVGQCGAKNLGC